MPKMLSGLCSAYYVRHYACIMLQYNMNITLNFYCNNILLEYFLKYFEYSECTIRMYFVLQTLHNVINIIIANVLLESIDLF